MCDYRIESKKALRRANGSARRALSRRALRPLERAVHDGRVRRGHDLHNGRPLPATSLAQGHYYTPKNFKAVLKRMDNRAGTCDWCGGRLPKHLVSAHRSPHDHREEIKHHHHADCWEARLLAVAVTFGHTTPQALGLNPNGSNGKSPRRRRRRVTEVMTVTKRVRVVRQYR